ncbi:hypothetical protein RHMOL_Rhmol10G0116900 [Rhododendron molle]|uniref:Uncharacterized protein n=1 Tax=Rhododendron molle TaxID=49168 RepID=A0ACC0M298_RHOML|nr:hypothetical protein RHMOL_Rhmol10G0116900 [Rhododendron molle]
MLKARFFSICEIHESCKENERNHYCLDCTTDALCPCYLIHHKNHRVTQIRRSSYHEVIKVEDIQKYLNVPDIQPYTMNKASVVLLNKRPQREPKKGYIYACDICQRGIAHHFKLCSLACKVIIGKHIFVYHFLTHKKSGTPSKNLCRKQMRGWLEGVV